MKKPFAISFILGAFMLLSSLLASLIAPNVMSAKQVQKLDLETIIPKSFAGWKIDSTFAKLMISPVVKGEINEIYDQTLSRTYINSQGEHVMLSIAYGKDQRTDLQIHRPENCYRASGFDIVEMTKTFVDTDIGRIPVIHMVARRGIRNEPITYWIRVGDSLTGGWFEQKLATLKYFLRGHVPDGLLFRISTISNDKQESYRIEQKFVNALLQAAPKQNRYWLIGHLSHQNG